MMGVPDNFKWFESSDVPLTVTLKKHAPNIRQCLGEAVPYPIAYAIASKIRSAVWNLSRFRAGKPLLKAGPWETDAQSAAYRNLKATHKSTLAAYYTQPLVAFSVLNQSWKLASRKRVSVLEPSSGGGVFLVLLGQLSNLIGKELEITSLDIDTSAINFQKELIQNSNYPFLRIAYKVGDYLKLETEQFDLIIGNPPFGRKALDPSSPWSVHQEMAIRFVCKAIEEGDQVGFVLPKALLHASTYRGLRNVLATATVVESIFDYGELCFPEIQVETIGLCLATASRPKGSDLITVKSWPRQSQRSCERAYCLDPKFPTWVIYRGPEFDRVLNHLSLGKLSAWRDRTITRKMSRPEGTRVIRGRNLQPNQIVATKDDYFVEEAIANTVNKKIGEKTYGTLFYAPNLSYYPRLVRRDEADGIPDGSAAVLFGNLSREEESRLLDFCNSEEFTNFFRIACNFATRSINLDDSLSFWWGVPH